MWVFFGALLGLTVGSFVNVVVVRLAAGERMNGRSRCRSCGTQLRWYHNAPLASFILLRGRCAFCRQPISWQYPLVEAATGALFALGAWQLAPDWLTLITFWVLAAYGVALFTFDYKHKLLPDVLTLSGAVVLLALNLARGLPLTGLALAMAVGAGFFGLQYALSRGKWIGSGDMRLGAFMGAALGWPQVLVALVLSYWAGALTGLGLMLLGRAGLKSELPFGTYLAASTLVTFLWGEELVHWYVGLVGGNL